MPAKPSNLFYAARDGVYTSFLPRNEPATALHNFVETYLSWSDEGGLADYRMLDTFLSDAISLHLLSKVVHQLKSRGGTLRVLLAAPDSAFACARGDAIAQDPMKELRTGVSNLRTALQDHELLPRSPVRVGRNETLSELAGSITSVEGRQALSIDVRFYHVAPSAPMYFFDDLLITSRFSYGSSSVASPWWLIVQDDRLEDDLYSSYRKEFDKIWASAEPNPISSSAPRLLSEEEQRATVLAVRIGENITERALYSYAATLAPLWEAVGNSAAVKRAERDVSVTPWTDGVVVAFLNPEHACLPLELAAELFRRYGGELDLRYAIVRGALVLVQTGAFTRHCVGAPNDIAGSLSRRVQSQCVAMEEQYYIHYVHEPERWGEVDETPQLATDLLGHGFQYRVLRLRNRPARLDAESR